MTVGQISRSGRKGMGDVARVEIRRDRTARPRRIEKANRHENRHPNRRTNACCAITFDGKVPGIGPMVKAKLGRGVSRAMRKLAATGSA